MRSRLLPWYEQLLRMRLKNEPTEKSTSKLTILAWCIYDWALGSFSVVVSTFVIAAYFTNNSRRISTSDVGPIWIVPFNDGRTELWEYNVADDSAYVVAELPRDSTQYDLYFH